MLLSAIVRRQSMSQGSVEGLARLVLQQDRWVFQSLPGKSLEAVSAAQQARDTFQSFVERALP